MLKSGLGISIPEETKDLYTENSKMMMKENEDDTNSWKDIPCSLIERINPGGKMAGSQ